MAVWTFSLSAVYLPQHSGFVRTANRVTGTVTKVDGSPVTVMQSGSVVPRVTTDDDGSVAFTVDRADLTGAPEVVVDFGFGALHVKADEYGDYLSSIATGTSDPAMAAIVSDPASSTTAILDGKYGGLSLDSLITPYTIAHNGTSDVYVGHTPEAYRYAWNAGLRVLDLDAQVLADGQLANIHDPTVDGITTSTGNVNTYSTMDFPQLVVDSSNIIGAAGYPNSRTMLVSEVMAQYGNRAIYCIEAKDGLVSTVQKIIDLADRLNLLDQIVVQCVNLGSLAPAASAGVKCQQVTNTPDVAAIQAAGVTGACLHSSYTSAIQSCVTAGLLTWVYGVNRRSERAAMTALGVDGIMSDNPIYSSSTTALTTRDLFIRRIWLAGHITSANSRGTMTATGELQWTAGQNATALAGFLCPVANPAGTYTINFTVTFDGLGSGSSYGALHICETSDAAFKNNISGGGYTGGYTVLLSPAGVLQVVKTDPAGTTSMIGQVAVAVPTVGAGVAIQVQVTPTQIIASIPAQSKSFTVTDSTYRGGYIHMVQNGLGSATQTRLSNITVT